MIYRERVSDKSKMNHTDISVLLPTNKRVNESRSLISFQGPNNETVIVKRIDIQITQKLTTVYMSIVQHESKTNYTISCSKKYTKEGQFNFFGVSGDVKIYLAKLFLEAEQLYPDVFNRTE